MGDTNPFEIIFAITAIVIIFMTCFALVGPSILGSLNVNTANIDQVLNSAPKFPVLQNLNGKGNEAHEVKAYDTVSFNTFIPSKQVAVVYGVISLDGTGDAYQVRRAGNILYIIPLWVNEPVYSVAFGNKLDQDYITTTSILDNFDGANSTFNVDPGTIYQAYIVFTPLAGYNGMIDSWNNGHGFTVQMYTSLAGSPSWTDQIGSFMSFLANIISYFVLYVIYTVEMMGIAGTLLGLSPVIGGAVAVLVIILFGGSMLMFLRGSSGNK
jgi:hypothetical protein